MIETTHQFLVLHPAFRLLRTARTAFIYRLCNGHRILEESGPIKGFLYAYIEPLFDLYFEGQPLRKKTFSKQSKGHLGF